MKDEIRELADAQLEGALTEQQRARLEALLRDDVEALDHYLSIVDLHASLAWSHRGTAASRRNVLTPILAVAAALLLLSAGLFLFFPSAPVRVVRSAEAAWDVEGPRLHRLKSGVAELAFRGGATVLLQGPAELEAVDGHRATLRSGRALATGTFTLLTAAGDVRTSGKVGVRVDGPDVSVQVYEGEAVSRGERLAAGQAARLGAGELAFHPDRFAQVLPGPENPAGRGSFPYNRPRFDELHLVPASRAPLIDGDLSDWDLSGRFRSACDPPYETYAVEGALMYDADFLYIGAHVADPFPMRSRVPPDFKRENYGQGGSLAFRFQTDRARPWPARGFNAEMRKGRPPDADDLNPNLVFMVLWYYAPERIPGLYLRYTMNFLDAKVNPPGYRGAFRKDADGLGYTAEYAIPWTLLNAGGNPPRGGDVLSASWLVHWSGEDGWTWKGQLIDGVNPDQAGWNFMNAGTWGRAIYHASGPLPPGTVRPRLAGN
ncbi:MAG TPA: hypothetical protein VEJ18_10915 [Planctomycetota bacterium]|nr:hypothetical protein [Planctomycetota bacterium]